jgi:prophage regulatory protein
MEAILRLPAVKSLTGLSRSSIYAKVRTGEFPQPIAIGLRSVGWIDSEIQQWIAARIADSRKDAVEKSL